MAQPGATDADARGGRAGAIVRLVLLAVALAAVEPVVSNGDALAAPAVALCALAVLAVVVFALVHGLLTRGASGRLAQRVHLTPDRVLLGGALVVGAASVAGLVWLHAQQHRVHSGLAQLDLRAASTATRLVGERDLMGSLNQNGIRTMVLLGGLLVLAAVAVGAFRSAALLALTMGITGVLVEFLKTSPAPPAPTLGLVTQHSTSWPSGHAALQASIALGVLLWWWAAELPRPAIIAVVAVPLAVLIGYSRAFLGIHWLSEVLAGWLVAAAAAAFVLAVDRLVIPRLHMPPVARPWVILLAGVVAAVVTVVSVHSVQRFHDRGPRNFPPGLSFRDFDRSPPPSGPAELLSVAPSAVLGPLPHYSETLLGGHDQPVNLVLVANADRVHAAFDREAWSVAGVVTPRNLLPELWSGVRGHTKSDAPSAPVFYDTRAPDFVLRRPADASGATADEVDVWELPVMTTHGCSLWAVTASVDQRTEWDWSRLFPVRRRASGIDTARDQLARSLAADGKFDDLGRFAFVRPGTGSGSGGSYTTDGKVALLRQAGCG